MTRETMERELAKIYANSDEWHCYNEEAIGNFKELKEAWFDDYHDGDYVNENEPKKYFYVDKNGNEVAKYSEGIEMVKNHEWTKWYENEVNAWAEKFAKEHGLNTKDDWYTQSYELSGLHWYESENEYAQMLLDNYFFCEMTDEELIEDYNERCPQYIRQELPSGKWI